MTKQPIATSDTGRLDQVDGLRAIAILWVAIYHYAVFWTPAGKGDPLVPYGDMLAGIPLAGVGFLGVNLFFIISGFVIAFSLTRSAGIGQFAVFRAIRLWPTMVICASITFVLTRTFGPDEFLRSSLEYLISLSFVPPPHVGKIIGQPGLEWLDGAYWSLWTEVRFYAIAAILFFTARRRFLLLWTMFAILSMAVHLLGLTKGGVFDALSRLIFAEYQPYFSAGIALAMLRANTQRGGALALLSLACGQALAYAVLPADTFPAPTLIGIAIVFALAIPTVLTRRAVPILSWGGVVLAGQASYAYYLLHQNAGLALLGALAPGNGIASVIVMIAVQVGLLAGAIVLTTRIEAPLRGALRKRLGSRSAHAIGSPP